MFNMKHSKPVSTPLARHVKLSKKSCPSTRKEKEEMLVIPYSSVVGSLMYAMVLHVQTYLMRLES